MTPPVELKKPFAVLSAFISAEARAREKFFVNDRVKLERKRQEIAEMRAALDGLKPIPTGGDYYINKLRGFVSQERKLRKYIRNHKWMQKKLQECDEAEKALSVIAEYWLQQHPEMLPQAWSAGGF